MKIAVEALVQAPLEVAWKTYTTPEDIVQWNAVCDDWHTTKSTVDLRVGGEFCSRMEAKDGSSGFDFAGTYTKVVPNQFLAYSFGDRVAEIEFAEISNGVMVKVTFDAETTHSIEQQRAGWQAILNKFARYAETRKSLR